MAMQLEITRDHRGVATLTLDRPDIRNAFDEALISALQRAIDELARDASVRLVVLAARGRVFCAGADLNWMRRAASQAFQDNLDDARRFAAMMRALAELPKPVLARVQGPAYGGGVGLVCAADIAVASDAAHFTLSEARLGIVPAVISPFLIQAVGIRQARRLALTCTRLDAHEALALGLIHQVVPEAELDTAVETIVAQLLAGAPGAHAATKALFARLAGRPLDADALELGAMAIATQRASPEAREGFAAFLGKRTPSWVPPTD